MSEIKSTDEQLAEINAKLDYIIATVEQTVGLIASHPMLKSLGIKF